MKPEAQRIAIAKACPFVTKAGDSFLWVPALEDGTPGIYARVFKPLSDLNAMHEAEKVLTAEQRSGCGGFTDFLGLVVRRENDNDRIWDFAHATAAQRAEAMCRTLWPERFP